MVKNHPGVRVMVDHCGIPYERDADSMTVWREGGWYVKELEWDFEDKILQFLGIIQ